MSYILYLAGGMLLFRAFGFSVDDSFRWSIVFIFFLHDMKELVFSTTRRTID